MSIAALQSLISKYALLVAAAIAFAASVTLALHDHTASAAVMAGLFALTVLFVNFPSIDSFKAWGVEAKMIRDTLAEAKASLDHFRKLVTLSGQQTFWALSKQGRWGSEQDLFDKEQIAAATTSLMIETGIDPERIKEAQAPYTLMINVDLSNFLRTSMLHFLRAREAQLSQALSALDKVKPDSPNVSIDERAAAAAVLSVNTATIERVAGEPSGISGLQAILRDRGFRSQLDDREVETLDQVSAKIEGLWLGVLDAGHLTAEAERFFRLYEGATGRGAIDLVRHLQQSRRP